MDNLLEALFDWYFVSIDLLLIVGTIYFFKLPKEKKQSRFYWLPFLILAFTVLYENLGAVIFYNPDFNAWVNKILGNTVYPQFNIWFFNITNRYCSTILYLFLIKTWLEPSKQRYLNWMILGYILLGIIFLVTGYEPIYLNQPVTFAVGANMILAGSGLYFIGLITYEKYLAADPIRLLSFWQMTTILFTYSVTYINSVSITYLYEVNPQLGVSLINIDMIMSILNLFILMLIVVSPNLKWIKEEPLYGSH
ncbi:histidine kinase [Algoriphagus namhaensis]|uniref:Histidine kinase n=1 Tax=Algoriphagus namhaensis TaxID=915353 RepID=A0ABV8ARS9_9BACT